MVLLLETEVISESPHLRVYKEFNRGGLRIFFIESGKPEALNHFLMQLNKEAYQKSLEIYCGIFWILQAIAINEINQGNITAQNIREINLETILFQHFPKLEELVAQLVRTTIYDHSVKGKPPCSVDEHAKSVWRFFEHYFNELTFETIKARERLHECTIIMVAGQQGVGKGEVTRFFEKKGFEVFSMSKIVKEMLQAWGLDPTKTIDKIVGGQIAKEYFKPDILVQLVIHYLISIGKTKIVLDGPRVIEEALAVQNLGGKLIGVIANPDEKQDRQIRLERIKNRSRAEPTRRIDVEKFDEREQIEFERIQAILNLVPSEHIIVNNISISELGTLLNAKFATSL